MQKTKIICTIGPASESPEILREMILGGMNVARLNFSHGSHPEHLAKVENIKKLRHELKMSVAILLDTKGPEIRLGTFDGGKVELKTGSTFILTTDQVVGDNQRAAVSYTELPNEVSTGTRILLDDGLIELIVESVSGKTITTRIINGGIISNRKSVNVPSVSLKIPYLCAKDRSDLRFIVENGFDLIAASFVRNEVDVKSIRDELHRIDSRNKIKIIAKIENADGVNNVDSILSVCDGIMIARGDLGVELEYEELPVIQKDLIKRTLQQGKPVITATQMLESMILNPRPPRAKTSEVANAIFDGTSAIMLSGETAVGKYPVEALAAMSKIAERIEKSIDYRAMYQRREYKTEVSITNAISHATVTTSHDLHASAILTVSLSGKTAQSVAKYRPTCPIIACTPDPVVRRQLMLNWGVIPLLTSEDNDTTELFNHAVEAAIEAGCIKEGELVVLTAGVPVGYSGTTNLLKVHVVGEKILV